MNHKVRQKEVAAFMRRLYKIGLTTGLGGNISLKKDGFIYITASQTDKAKLKSDMVCILDADGNPIEGGSKNISMESGMHRAVYAACPQATAIIHAHPPLSTAFGVAEKLINTRLTAEGHMILGEPLIVDYAPPGSLELAEAVAAAAKHAQVMLMKNHGVIAYGNSLSEAFERIEVLENMAKIHLVSLFLGKQTALTDKDIFVLNQLVKQ